MKSPRLHAAWPALLLAVALGGALHWRAPHAATDLPVASPGKSVSRATAVTTPRQLSPSPATPPTSGTLAAVPPPSVPVIWKDPYQPMLTGAKLERVERRMFQAQTWEVDLAKALELPPGERLERRSGVFHLPGAPYPRVRVDRVYRLGATPLPLPAPAAAPTPNQPKTPPALPPPDRFALEAGKTPVLPEPATTAAPIPPAPNPTGLLDAGGGEVVWSNAMVADHLMVQVEPGVTTARLAHTLPASARIRQQITAAGLYLVGVPADGDRSVERAILAFNQLKGVVKFAEPDFLLTGADTTPDDPLFTPDASDLSKQWHLPKIMAPRAWDVIKSPKTPTIANSTVVAIVDTGVDYTHPDLATNIWNNVGETGGGKETNGIDDDANGKIDDWRGWNFVELNNNVMDDVGHGTHVAGVVGAIGNNATGTSGVCWGVKILPLRIIKKQGAGTFGTYSSAIAALDYIRVLNTTGRKVAVANHSWGGNGYSLAMLNAINNPVSVGDPLPTGLSGTFQVDVNTLTVSGNATEIAKIKIGMSVTGAGIPANALVTIVSGSTITLTDYTSAIGNNAALAFGNPVRPKAYGVIHVAAAGNSRFNADRIPIYPASLPSGFIVSVGATDSSDNMGLWAGGAGSNYGRLNVDLFAPGSSIWSTKWKAPGDATYGYESRNGTSMAAPQAAGALALVRMWQPNLTEFQARQVLIEQVTPVAALETKCVSGGRLNIAKIIDRLYQPILVGSGGGTVGGGVSAEALAAGLGVTGQAAKGSHHTLAVRHGRVWAWGDNSYGELGTSGLPSSQSASAVPVAVTSNGSPLDGVMMVSAGQFSSYALKFDGTVWSWGSNLNGALGIGSSGGNPNRFPTPQQVGLWDGSTASRSAVWISATNGIYGNQVLVAGADGSVWSWGTNEYGQLGDGTQTARTAPVQVPGLDGVIMVAAGPYCSLALKADGTVWQWGVRFGTLNYANRNLLPVQVAGLSGIVYIAVGNAGEWGSAYAIDTNGSVWWFGTRLPVTQISQVPLPYAGLSRMVCIAAGNHHALGMDAEGRLLAWGDNAYGQLGNGTLGGTFEPTPVLLDTTEGIAAIAANTQSSMAVLGSGQVACWGKNSLGELGRGQLDSTYLPVRVDAGGTIDAMQTGAMPFARRQDGAWINWGGHPWGGEVLPRAFNDFGPFVEVRSGSDYPNVNYPGTVVAKKSDGTLWAWGVALIDYAGQFGNPSLPLGQAVNVPPSGAVRVGTLAGVSSYALAPGSYFSATISGSFIRTIHGVAALADGSVWTWGANIHGQLGDGTSTSRNAPVSVPGIGNVVEVVAGGAHTLARKGDGTVWAWGRNTFGQLGDGSTTDRTAPVQVTGLSNIIRISAGLASNMALRSDGKVWVWGRGSEAPLLPFYDSTSGADVSTPRQITGLPTITAIDAGSGVLASYQSHALALDVDGRVWAWGSSYLEIGRLPDSSVFAFQPAPVVALSHVVAIASGVNCAYAIRNDGSLWAWGANWYGGIGDDSYVSPTPAFVVGFGGTSQTLSTLGTGSTADSWFLQNFSLAELLDDSLVSDTANPAGDGIPNLIKYALGLNPRQRYGASSLPTARVDFIGGSGQSAGVRSGLGLFSVPTVNLSSGKRYLALSVPRNSIHLDVDYLVEVSGDLLDWRSGDPHTVTVLDTAETLEVYSAAALEDVQRQFMRLKIQRK